MASQVQKHSLQFWDTVEAVIVGVSMLAFCKKHPIVQAQQKVCGVKIVGNLWS